MSTLREAIPVTYGDPTSESMDYPLPNISRVHGLSTSKHPLQGPWTIHF